MPEHGDLTSVEDFLKEIDETFDELRVDLGENLSASRSPDTVLVLDRIEAARSKLNEAIKLRKGLWGEGSQHYLVLPVHDHSMLLILSSIAERLPHMRELWKDQATERRIERLVAELAPKDSGTSGSLELDNAIARAEFVQKHPCLTSAQIHEISGSRSTNKSVPATRWKNNGLIFSLSFNGRELYPAFQFKDGKPRPVIRKLLDELPNAMGDWEKAFWFVSNNGWIRGEAAPVETLDDEEAVLSAARVMNEPTIG